MLEFLRQQVKSPIFQAIIIMIVLVFLFWVPQMGSGNSRDSIATVNGESISFSSYNTDYNRTVDQLREQFQGNLPKGFIETLGIKNQVLQRLIHDELLIQGATKMGIYVSDWEIQEQIRNQDFFLTDGVFDKTKYHNLLAKNNLSAKKYEASQRSAILNQKTRESLANFATLTSWETTTRFQYYLNEIQLNYAVLTPELFSESVSLDEEKIVAYFDQHKEEYKTAPEIKLNYLHFSLSDAMQEIHIDDATINSYYENNKDNYAASEQRKARHILLRTDGSNNAKQKTQAEEVLKKLQAGGDFAALAKEFSDDAGSAINGGDLGFFDKGQMVPAFDTAVFAMENNQLSELVKTRFGYHIIQLQEISPATVTSLEEVSATIVAAIKKSQAKGKAFEAAGTAYEKIFQAGSLATYASQENITLQETAFFTQKTPAPALAGRPKVLSKAFELKKGELSSMLESHDGYYILYITDTIEPKIPELVAVRDEVVDNFTNAEATLIAKDTATALLIIAKEEGLQASLSAKNIAIKTSPWFSRQQSGKSSLPQNVTLAGFSLSASSKYPSEILMSNNEFYVIEFSKMNITDTKAHSETKMFKQALLQEKQATLLNSWIDHMKATSKIKINTEFMAR